MNEEQKSLTLYLRSDESLENFAEVIGSKSGASAYVASVLIAVRNEPALLKCSRESIFLQAMRAATLRLNVDPATKQAYLIPFKGKANLIIGYKGLYDMAIRTGQYKIIHVSKIYKGERIVEDRITGMIDLQGGKESNEIAGWLAYFEMNNGLKKYVYMTREEIHEYASLHSVGYSNPNGAWKKYTEAMERKTPLRILLTQWGILDTSDQAALMNDEYYQDEESEVPDFIEGEFSGNEETETAEESIEALGYSSDGPQHQETKTQPRQEATKPKKEQGWPLPEGRISKDDYYNFAYSGSLGFTADPELAQQIEKELNLQKGHDYSYALKKLANNFPFEKEENNEK